MRRALRALGPTSLRGQLLLAVLLALAVAQGVGAGIAMMTRQQAVRAAQMGDALDRAAALIYVIERTPSDLHGNILRAAETPLTRLSIDPVPLLAANGGGLSRPRRRLLAALSGTGAGEVRMAVTTASGRAIAPTPPAGADRQGGDDDLDKDKDWRGGDGRDAEARHEPGPDPLGGPPRVRPDPDRLPRRHGPPAAALDSEALRLSVGLASGAWLNAEMRFPRRERGLPALSLFSFVLAAAAIGAALWLTLARLLGPLRGLATAAEGLGRGEVTAPLPARGPSEMRALTEAFNAMQQRLHRMVSDRTQMLAALGHDLRSPLTALRVQAEMVDEDETRERLMTSLAEMQEMVEQTLTYARGVWTAEATEAVDAGALLADLAAEGGAEGGAALPVRLPHAPVTLRLRPATIRRALRNLIDNARRYGGPQVTLALTAGPDTVTIEVADRGPGIPVAELAHVFDPFVRLEASRSRETGGAGLGLSIARSIVQAHGGEVTLANREGGGLVATVTLPRPRAG